MAKQVFLRQFDAKSLVMDYEKDLFKDSPVVPGQALTGDEISRRLSAGLPIGASVRNYNGIDPHLEKFAVYDSISAFRLRHGMVVDTELEKQPEQTVPENEQPPVE